MSGEVVVRQHDFNTRWWGEAVGIVTDSSWTAFGAEALRAACSAFAWVEYVDSDPAPQNRWLLQRAGFVHADTQLQFRVDLRPHATMPLAGDVTVGRAPGDWRDAPWRDFAHERFLLLAGCDSTRLRQRYVQWAADLAVAAPETCLEFRRGDRAQGWFFSRPGTSGLELTLAMGARDASWPGAALYASALGVYARAGHRVGHAGFSVRNKDVHNIYAALGARFTGTREVWLWQRVE